MLHVVNTEFHHSNLVFEFRVHVSKLQFLLARGLVKVNNPMSVLNGDIAYVADAGIAVITKVLDDSFLFEFMGAQHRPSKQIFVVSRLKLSEVHSAMRVTPRNNIVCVEAFLAHKCVTRKAERAQCQLLLAVSAGRIGIIASFGDEEIK